MSEPLPDLRAGRRPFALFLDVDGTLLELAEHPDSVVVPPGLVALLARMRDSLDGALALVSGRSLASLDALLGAARLDAAGCHGAEMRINGKVRVLAGADKLVSSLGERLARLTDGIPLTLVEVKTHSVALHYRTPHLEPDAAFALARQAVGEMGQRFRILRGKQVVEILPVGAGKGTAISQFLAEAPYKGRRPVFAGDDVTDEEGFREVNRRRGISVRVGISGETAARFRLETTRGLLSWLSAQVGGEA